MKINFRVNHHTEHEITMGHKLGFTPIPWVDVISATANMKGFTPLRAIRNRQGWEEKLIELAAKECNDQGEIAIVSECSPTLLLVPKTKNRVTPLRQIDFLTKDLIAAVNKLNAKYLHFTHFGFVQGILPFDEIYAIFRSLLNPKIETSLEIIYFELDARCLDVMTWFYRDVVVNELKYQTGPLEWSNTDRFEWVYDENMNRGTGELTAYRFVRASA